MRSRPESHPLLGEARATTRRVSRTFGLACRLLPREVRDDVYLLYLVFRRIDDAVDEGSPDAADRVAALEAWASPGSEALAADATCEVRILRSLAQRYPIPRAALLDFCTGMREDLSVQPIATEADLDRYCYRVAGTVGI